MLFWHSLFGFGKQPAEKNMMRKLSPPFSKDTSFFFFFFFSSSLTLSGEVFPVASPHLHSPRCRRTRCQVSRESRVASARPFISSSSISFLTLRLDIPRSSALRTLLCNVPLFYACSLARPCRSPRPSHLHTSSPPLSVFSPLLHPTAVLFPPSVSLRLWLSVSCFLLRNLPGEALSVSLRTFFFFFLLILLQLLLPGCLILSRASKRKRVGEKKAK